MVVAKFKLVRYETSMGSKRIVEEGKPDAYKEVEQRTLIFQPVYSDKPGTENKKFWDATPTGEIRLGVVNQEAWKYFELNKPYLVTFENAE